MASAIDFEAVTRTIAQLRQLDARSVDVSASFLGRRNYSRYDIEDAVGDALSSRLGCRYASRRTEGRAGGDVSIRVHLTSERTTIAIRIGARPLHRRAYRIASRPGALHPPLARALVLLTGLRPGETFLDPLCGTGTILIEAKLACPESLVEGSDVDVGAVDAACRNAGAAGAPARITVADAAGLPRRAGSVHRIATNPPWGIHVVAKRSLRDSLEPLWTELPRVLDDGGRLVLLTAPGDGPSCRLGRAGLRVVLRNPVRVSGALAEIVVLGHGTRT
jgi:tRNA (guanine6-N2)-methyltransferase